MARDMEPVLKRCRALDISPAYLGIMKESRRVGRQNTFRRKLSEYGLQLREKQRVKFIYGLMEKQFRLTFERARKMKGMAGENLLILLELRLDNVMFRMNIGDTRRQARQIVTHGHIFVNGRCVNIPSYVVKPGDVITIRETSKKSPLFQGFKENQRPSPAWLSVDMENLTGTVVRLPEREDIDLPFDESLIVEFYSK
ncbi:MAG TPA: 30S ribosomal protein S4 [Clostridiales bacterium]|nr:30S ribosomal protein S4 [Clostridiales bacterium]